jgi:hypothetical protein
MDVHEHHVRAAGEGVFNRLRATMGLSDDLIPKAAELFGQV